MTISLSLTPPLLFFLTASLMNKLKADTSDAVPAVVLEESSSTAATFLQRIEEALEEESDEEESELQHYKKLVRASDHTADSD